MANYCYNTFTITGNTKQLIEEFYKINYKDERQPLSFEKLVPTLSKEKEGQPLNNQVCSEMWGTKWDAMDFGTTSLENNTLIYDFYTARSPPTTWLHKVARIYPELYFVLEYNESGRDFWGKQIYEKGWMIDEEHEPLGERNWRLCNKEILEKHIDNSMDLITKENYPLRIHNIVDDYAFEAANHKNIEPYVEHIVKQKLGLI